MTSTLAEFENFLVTKGYITKEHLESAQHKQIVFGGAIDTNLLELKLITYSNLMGAYEEWSHLKSINFKIVESIPIKLSEIVPQNLAESLRIAPLHLSQNVLTFVTDQKITQKLINTLSEKFNFDFAFLIGPEFRLFHAFHRLYGFQIPPRYLSLISTFDGITIAIEPKKPIVPQVKPVTKKLTFHESLQALDEADNRDVILNLLNQQLSRLYENIALFAIDQNYFQGWSQRINGKIQPNFKFTKFPFEDFSVLRTVYMTRGHYLGPLEQTPANASILNLLNRDQPKSALVAPLVIDSKVGMIVFCDRNQSPISNQRVSATLILLQKTGQALAKFIQKKKQPLSSSESPSLNPSNENITENSHTPNLENVNQTSIEEMVKETFEGQEIKDILFTDSQLPKDIQNSVENFRPQFIQEFVEETTKPSIEEKPTVISLENDNTSVPEQFIEQFIEQVIEQEPEIRELTSPGRPRLLYDNLPTPENLKNNNEDEVLEGYFEDTKNEIQKAFEILASNSKDTFIKPEYPPTLRVHQLEKLKEELLSDNKEISEEAIIFCSTHSNTAIELVERYFPGPLPSHPFAKEQNALPAYKKINGITQLTHRHFTLFKDVLKTKLKSPQPETRFVTLLHFIEHPDEAIFDDLAEALYDQRIENRILAAEALLYFKKTPPFAGICKTLMQQLQVNLPSAQLSAIQLLAFLRSELAVESMIALVFPEQNPAILKTLIWALRKITGHNFNHDQNKWKDWYSVNQNIPRAKWLIDALFSNNILNKDIANKELEILSGMTAHFNVEDSPEKQSKAIQLWKNWFKKEFGV